MYIVKAALLVAGLFLLDGIYDYQLTDINGNTINMSDFQGKKILIVNTATNSKYAGQYASLEQLYQTYSDSLVVIAVPSNSFGNEPNSDDSIKTYVMNTYNIHYILTSQLNVVGDSSAPLFQWLEANNQSPNNDFCKILISDSGQVIGAFDGSVDPMDPMIQDMIKNQ